ncbi:MAG: cell division protein FtsA [Halothermotrichaceae bacterium]
MDQQGDLIFTLDIGTRTVIGLVLEYKDGYYQILDSHVEEHEERAMLDGQIHNVNLVANQVKKVKNILEDKIDIKLERVAIAAAGRALKTVNYNNKIELEEKRLITEEDVQNLEFSAVQKAQKKLVSDTDDMNTRDYHFVGYSVKEYILDGMTIGNLEGQKGQIIQTKIIATFLPRVVVESLLSVINKAELKVEYLTLEPIAAANVVIPKDMYNFNLALVDIGAGTSDIALTKGGSMIAYAMVPVAGDEITEALAENYLLDYKTGEKLKCELSQNEEVMVKNILSQDVVVNNREAVTAIKSVIESLASQISEVIMTLNKKKPQALICVGGGSLTPGLLDELARFMDIDRSRIGIKEYKDIANVKGEVPDLSTAQVNTPIGIALSAHQNTSSANFIDIKVNGNKYQLFTLNKATLADALISAEIDLRKLQGLPGMGLTCTVNGNIKVIKGEMGTPGTVLLNNQEVNDLEKIVDDGDEIIFKSGKEGVDAKGVIADVIPDIDNRKMIYINGNEIDLKPEIYQNGRKVDLDTKIKDGAEINYVMPGNVREVLEQIYGLDIDSFQNQYIYYKVNGEKKYLPEEEILVLYNSVPVDLDIPLVDDMELEVIKFQEKPLTLKEVMDENFKDSISIIFNGSQLEIPVKGNIYCNKKKVGLDYEIESGDEIVYKNRAVSIKYVFDFVNFTVTPFIDNFKITVNGKPAGMEEFIKDGDKITVTQKKESNLPN